MCVVFMSLSDCLFTVFSELGVKLTVYRLATKRATESTPHNTYEAFPANDVRAGASSATLHRERTCVRFKADATSLLRTTSHDRTHLGNVDTPCYIQVASQAFRLPCI